MGERGLVQTGKREDRGAKPLVFVSFGSFVVELKILDLVHLFFLQSQTREKPTEVIDQRLVETKGVYKAVLPP